MLKKLFIIAAAAAALSVPLAGTAWAEPPSDSGSSSKATNPNPSVPPGQSDNGPGIPRVGGAFLSGAGANPNPGGTGPVTPGQVFNVAKKAFPGVSTPVAVGEFVNGFYNSHGVPTTFGPTPPGLATKTFTPGCSSGRAASDAALGPNPICNNPN
jgi:hypothetical protein